MATAENRLRQLRSPCITLRDRRNCDDAVARARRSPSTVKHDAEERPFVATAEECAVQALRSRDATEELAVRCKDIHRLARRHIDPALLVDGRSVATFAALQFAELALIGQRTVCLDVERVD